MRGTIKEMEEVNFLATGQSDGNGFIWRAKTLESLVLTSQQKHSEALQLLQETLARQKQYFGSPTHASIEHTLGQLAQTAVKLN